MILNTVPSSSVNVNGNNETTPYIQIGLETGQKSWEMSVRYPEPGHIGKTHYLFKGHLHDVAEEALKEIEIIAGFARQRQWQTNVVYEAGAFGQKLGRDIKQVGANPIQLVARNIEYVRFGNQKDIPKTDKLDALRQSHIPLDHPDLPYADVQEVHEEERRVLFNERKRLDKCIHRYNGRMCALLRTCHIGSSHHSAAGWIEFFEREQVQQRMTTAKLLCLKNLLEQLNDATKKREKTNEALLMMMDDTSKNWQQPNPDPQPAQPGRHPLQGLGKNSPLREKSLPESLLAIKGIGVETVLTMLAFVGDPRRFEDESAFRAFMGLSTTPFRSCSINKSMGMKRGNPLLRRLLIQLAWNWCNMHPDSHLAEKYVPKIGGSRRTRKIAACALAGEIAELLYNYLVHGKHYSGLNVKTG